MPQIEVTFDIDANGILKVTAADKASGRSQHITITASSGLSETEIEKMRQEAEANADADKRRKDLIEAKNQADNAVYTAEKMLRDYGDKVPAEVKKKVEDSVSRLKTTMGTDNTDQIRQDIDALNQDLQAIGSSMYGQPGGPQEGGPTGPDQTGGAGPQQGGPDSGPSGEDVVDGEFHNA
jgi:molecular chaperone DnaK